ncbi:hypothetical protein GQ457_11G029130 [Hibiscus cannabinus]
MDVEKMKQKKNVLQKAWERCRALGNTGKKPPLMRKSKSLHVFSSLEEDNRKKKKMKCSQVAPQGCFSVYVGPRGKDSRSRPRWPITHCSRRCLRMRSWSMDLAG